MNLIAVARHKHISPPPGRSNILMPMLTILLMFFLALLMTSSIPYPKIRDLRLMILFSSVYILVAAILLWRQDAGNILYAALLLAALILLYMISPVVIKRLRKERWPPLRRG